MSVDKIEGIWCETGTKESTLTAAKKLTGWTRHDQPAIERLNYLQYRADFAINKIVDHLSDPGYEDTDPRKVLSTQLWGVDSTSWYGMKDAANTISGGSAKAYVDLNICFDTTVDEGKTPLVMALHREENANQIDIYNARTLASFGNSGTLAGLELGGGELWEAHRFCTDGTYVYVTYVDMNASPVVWRLQAYNISDWAVKAGWAATGTALPGNDVSNDAARVIVASATKLATCNTWIPATAAGTSNCISIIDIDDGTIDASGCGDAATGTYYYPSDGICSDGTNIYYTLKWWGAPTPIGQLASATIADPTAGCGGANWPYTDAVSAGSNCVHIGGGVVVSTWEHGTGARGPTNPVVAVHSATDADLDVLLRGQDVFANDGDNYIYGDGCSAMCFDGFNIWMRVHIESGANGQNVLLCIDAAQLHQLRPASAVNRSIGDVAKLFLITPDAELAHTSYGAIVFDGRDIWTPYRTAPSLSGSGNIHRLPKAVSRI